MSQLITATVGKKGRNRVQDVMVVQFFLNQHISYGSIKFLNFFEMDGKFTQQIYAAIVMFQRLELKQIKPSGRVKPGGSTMNALSRLPKDLANVGGVGDNNTSSSAVASKKTSVVNHNPIRIKPSSIVNISTGGSVAIRSIGKISSGKNYQAVHGDRLILATSQSGIVYLQLSVKDKSSGKKVGVVYVQTLLGFKNDILYAGIAEAGRRLAATQVVIKAEMDFLMGVACAVNPWISAVNTGLTVLEWIGKNKRKFPKWLAAISTILLARSILKQHTPKLYDKIIDGVFYATFRLVKGGVPAIVSIFGADTLGNLPASSVGDPKKAGKLAGGLISVALSSMDEKALNKRFFVLKLVFNILKKILMHALSSVPAALGEAVKTKEKAAADIIKALINIGVAISEEDSKIIVEEVWNNAGKVKTVISDLNKAFEAFK